jgi:dehydratase
MILTLPLMLLTAPASAHRRDAVTPGLCGVPLLIVERTEGHMKTRRITRVGTMFGAVAMAAGAVLVAAAPASAAPQAINYDCQATTGFGNSNATFERVVEATAPETVAPGGDLTVTISSAPATVPTTASGLTVRSVRSFRSYYTIPENTTLVSASLSGGSDLGAEPVLTVEGNKITVTLDAEIPAGSTYQMPALTLNLTAGQEGTIEVKLGGTSYADPGLFFITQLDFLGMGLDAWTSCFPNPSPVLATTTITP